MSSKKCFICGSDMSNFLIGKDFALGTSEKQYTIIKCSNCGLEEVHPMPNREEQATFYPKNYYSYENKKQAKKNQLNLMDIGMKIFDFLFRLFEPKGYYISDYKNSNGKKFIDIGCGEGINLDAMTKKGWESFGFEIGKQERKGNIFYGGNVKDVNRGTLKFDLIYMSHVFEHIDTPEETLETLKKLLNDNGKIVILLPSSNSLSSLILGKYAPERDIPRHLFTYNKKNLSLLFKNKGFTIKSSNSLKQYGLLVGFARYLKDKFKFNLKNSKLKYIFFFVFIIELLLTMIKYTNHTGFVLEIKK